MIIIVCPKFGDIKNFRVIERERDHQLTLDANSNVGGDLLQVYEFSINNSGRIDASMHISTLARKWLDKLREI